MEGDQNSRDAEIGRLYEHGATMAVIGERYGITRERVRQIIEKNGRGVSSAEARELRRSSSETKRDQAVDEFLKGNQEEIQELANSGVSRSEVEERYALLMPNISRDIIRLGIDRSTVLFDRRNNQDLRFPDEVIEVSVWYALGRSIGIEADPRRAILVVDMEEARIVTEALRKEGVPETFLASVMSVAASARSYCRENSGVSLTATSYMAVRADVLNEIGVASSKGSWPWPPTKQTIMKRLGAGYWADAMDNVGIASGTRGRSRGFLKFDQEDYDNAVVEYLNHATATGQSQTFAGYQAWVDAEERSGRRRPSSDAVRMVYKSWTKAKRTAVSMGSVASTSGRQRVLINPGATDALRRCEVELENFLGGIDAMRQADISSACLSFVRNFAEEFEVSYRNWLRAMISLDPESIDRRSKEEKGMLSKKQLNDLREPDPDLDSILTGTYFGRMLSASNPWTTDGWLKRQAQSEMDRISLEDTRRFKVVRGIRNFFSHYSNESIERLEMAIHDLAEDDHRFHLKHSLTQRVLGDWISSSGAQRLGRLCQSIPNAWRAMVVAEHSSF